MRARESAKYYVPIFCSCGSNKDLTMHEYSDTFKCKTCADELWEREKNEHDENGGKYPSINIFTGERVE